VSARSLKRLLPGTLPAALEMAAHYRDLNQPEEAESICRDVLEVDPENQAALRTLGLALTDRFPVPLGHLRRQEVGLFEEAVGVFERLATEYERVYYCGVAWERSAKAHLERDEVLSAAVSLERALELFERAEKLAPAGSPEPVLRHNRCVRLLLAYPELDAAIEAPHADQPRLGD
jgi:tetratricopeptide (TPR) repeat protein